MKTAKFVQKLPDWSGDARLYKLSEPTKYQQIHEDEERTTLYVIVSAVCSFFSGDETYIFPATGSGEPINYLELRGSFQGSQNHALALQNAGYEVID